MKTKNKRKMKKSIKIILSLLLVITIGYISITKALADKLQADNKVKLDWKSWWLPTESDDTTSKTVSQNAPPLSTLITGLLSQ